MLGLFTFSTLAACVGWLGARWLVAWVVMSAAAITASVSRVSYSHPSIGHFTTGIFDHAVVLSYWKAPPVSSSLAPIVGVAVQHAVPKRVVLIINNKGSTLLTHALSDRQVNSNSITQYWHESMISTTE